MFIGPTQLDEEIGALVVSRNATQAPTAITGDMTITVYDGEDERESGTGSLFNSITGVYRCAVTPTEANGYTRGKKYDMLVEYVVSGQNRKEVFTFRVT